MFWRGLQQFAAERQVDCDRVSRLLLAVCLLTVWVVSVGRGVKVSGQAAALLGAAQVAAHSLFQVGCRWLRQQLTLGRPLIPDAELRFWHFIPK
jgi:hypothetical protein